MITIAQPPAFRLDKKKLSALMPRSNRPGLIYTAFFCGLCGIAKLMVADLDALEETWQRCHCGGAIGR